MLKGKTALVTGSTSGIGQSIAEAFAAQACNVVLNGFGKADEIEALRSAMALTHGVAVRYDPAPGPERVGDDARIAHGHRDGPLGIPDPEQQRVSLMLHRSDEDGAREQV